METIKENAIEVETNNLLKNEFDRQKLPLNDEIIVKFQKFYDFIVEKNKIINLTSITEKQDFYVKHYVDSLLALSYISTNATVLDLGCGGGFPSIPLKIARNDIKMTALDSTEKKIKCVQEAAKLLNLQNFFTVSARAEEYGRSKKRESLDIVVSRAVAPLNILLELALPLTKIGGKFIAYKTDENEADGAKNAYKMLGAVLVKTEKFTLPNGDKRCLFIFEKKTPTDMKFPRIFGQIKKSPL